ncbi:MAG: hypothetical protein IPM96_18775 [Ignavibacteria bacterium]|nr:hypothetical protein [Ignavibacteria bacterium]
MKTTLLLFSTAIILSLAFQKQSVTTQSSNDNLISQKLECPDPPSFIETVKGVPDNKSNLPDNENVDQGWYQSAIENIEKEEYNISYSEELGAFQSPNRANNIRFIYYNDGFTAMTRSNKIPLFDVNDNTLEEKDKEFKTVDEWSIDFKIQNEEYKITDGELKASGNKAYIENDEIRIDYLNEKKGMRQDFIIKKKPEVEGNLRLNIVADTKLNMIVGTDELLFKDKNGSEKMKYSGLKVWDATGKELYAYFEKTENMFKRKSKNQNHSI